MKNRIFILVFLSCITVSFSQEVFIQYGKASFYADKFEGKLTASGEKYCHTKLTAAHLNLPFGSRVRITNLENKKKVVVRINDRGPFVKGRIIDLSKAAAMKLGFVDQGVVDVKLEVLEGSHKQQVKKEQPRPGEKKSFPEINPGQIKKEISTISAENKGEYYQLQARKIQPGGFGIQVGSYGEAANLLEIAGHLKEKFNHDIIIQVAPVDENILYRVIVGKFPEKSSAAQLQKMLEKDYPGSFVLKYK